MSIPDNYTDFYNLQHVVRRNDNTQRDEIFLINTH